MKYIHRYTYMIGGGERSTPPRSGMVWSDRDPRSAGPPSRGGMVLYGMVPPASFNKPCGRRGVRNSPASAHTTPNQPKNPTDKSEAHKGGRREHAPRGGGQAPGRGPCHPWARGLARPYHIYIIYIYIYIYIGCIYEYI